MKLGDIIALAKLGYKKEDIEGLISLADTTAAAPDSTGTENGPEDEPAGEPEERTPEPDKEPEKTADDHTAEQITALQNQISDLKKQLDHAQKQNINKNNSGSGFDRPSDQDVLNDVMRNFM